MRVVFGSDCGYERESRFRWLGLMRWRRHCAACGVCVYS